MSEACILITYHVSLAFVFLYFQWHATKLFENLFFAVFSLLQPLFFLCTIVTVKILNTFHLSLEVTPSRLQIALISWPCSVGRICTGDSFIEDIFSLGLDLKESS